MDAPSPEREPEILPRPRGIRAGKSAVRKRKAYQAYQLALQPYRYRSIDLFSPVAASAGSSSSTSYSSFISIFSLFSFAIASFFDA